MKQTKQIFMTIIALMLTVALVSGGTFAYFVWQSGTGQNTVINVTVSDGINMVIDPTIATKTGMYPTNNCGGEAAMSGFAEVSITNETGTYARPKFKLKAKVEPMEGRTLTTAQLAYVNYAVMDGPGVACNLSKAVATGTLTGGPDGQTDIEDWGHYPRSGYLKTGSNYVTFDAPPYKTTKRMYTIWVWIDHMYNPSNMGINQDHTNDALQNATITFTWSENSIVEQVASS